VKRQSVVEKAGGFMGSWL